MVIEKALAVTLGLFVKFSTLQEYGVNRVFFLENANVDSSERNVVFLARGEKPAVVKAVAGKIQHSSAPVHIRLAGDICAWEVKVDGANYFLHFVLSVQNP